MILLPNDLAEVGPNSAFAKHINKISKVVKSIIAIPGPNRLIEHGPNGTAINPKPGEGGTTQAGGTTPNT